MTFISEFASLYSLHAQRRRNKHSFEVRRGKKQIELGVEKLFIILSAGELDVRTYLTQLQEFASGFFTSSSNFGDQSLHNEVEGFFYVAFTPDCPKEKTASERSNLLKNIFLMFPEIAFGKALMSSPLGREIFTLLKASFVRFESQLGLSLCIGEIWAAVLRDALIPALSRPVPVCDSG